MPEVPDFELDLTNLDGYPVALGHGTYDPVIPIHWGEQARDRLVEAGAAVTWRESPMPHAVDPDYLGELAGWIARVLDEPAAA